MIVPLRKIIASLGLLLLISWLISFVFDRTLVKINYWSNGCFHSTHSTCIATKQTNSIVVYLVLNDSIHKEKKLPLQYADTIDRFITQVKAIPGESGCTTVNYYSIESKQERFSKTDGTCDFNGYDQLIFSLFGQHFYELLL